MSLSVIPSSPKPIQAAESLILKPWLVTGVLVPNSQR